MTINSINNNFSYNNYLRNSSLNKSSNNNQRSSESYNFDTYTPSLNKDYGNYDQYNKEAILGKRQYEIETIEYEEYEEYEMNSHAIKLEPITEENEHLIDELAEKFIDAGGILGVKTGLKPSQTNILFRAKQKAEVPIYANMLTNILKENDLKIDENEEFNIKVDKYNNLTVEGNNKEKAKQIEDIFNEKGLIGSGLNHLTYGYSKRYKGVSRDSYVKSSIENELKYYSNGEVTFSDLKLENGQIKGLPKKLDGLVNGTKEDMTYRERVVFSGMKEMMVSLLNKGEDNIKDLTTNVTFKNGELKFH